MRRTGLLALTVLVGLAGPAGVSAQRERPAQALLEGSLSVTSVHGRAVGMAGGAALLRIGSEVFFGGAGYVMLRPRDLSRPGSALNLRMGYGGLLVGTRLHAGARVRWTARILLGAGNAKAVVPVVGTELGSDNFGVVEPQITATVWTKRFISIEVGAGYRLVYGVQDLPRVGPEQLGGAVVTGSLTLDRF